VSTRLAPPAAAVALAALAALAAASAPAAADDELVVTTDGRRLTGEVAARGDLVTVDVPGPREVFLSAAVVASRGAPPAREEGPVYRFNEGVAAAGRKRGEVALVVEDFRWEGPFERTGRVRASLKDPRLGRIELTLVLTTVTPETATLEAVEYEYALGVPTGRLWGVVRPLVDATLEAAEPAALGKAARFFRLAGEREAARSVLARLMIADPEAAAAEEARLTRAALGERLAELERLARVRVDEAVRLARELTPGDAPPGPGRELVERLRAQGDVLERARARLAAAGFDVAPTVAGAARLVGAAERLESAGADVPPALLARLAEPWAAPVGALDLSVAEVEAAAALADAIAALWAAEEPGRRDVRRVARDLARAELPLALKAALLAGARDFAEPAARSAWTRVDYAHPESRDDFHYYVRVPASYRPDRPTPALVVLHGMHSDAEGMGPAWFELAEAYGVVLISPEYVYGRDHGYRFSVEEHAAVLGAVRHAARTLNLDPDRVVLSGHSQGGHASWDLGPAHAGVFAAVMPVIGVAVHERNEGNCRDVPVYCVDGSEDADAPAMNRRTIARLAEAGCDATYVEYAGRGHEAFAEEFDAMLRWALGRRRDPAPAALHLTALRRCDVRRAWLEVAGTRRRLPASNRAGRTHATVEARWADGRVTLRAENATAVTVYVSPRRHDLARELRIAWGGRVLFADRVEPDWELALTDALTRRDGAAAYLAAVTVRPR